MNKIKFIGACSDLGCTVDGADKGPKEMLKDFENVEIIDKPSIIKSKDPKDLRKNLDSVNEFNTKLFNIVKRTIEDDMFPITIGGDHSIAIGSALASQSIHNNLGIIWIDAHLDYNTFETTITGNLHGLPLAAINGICKDLTPFTSNFINPKNTVVVGYRAKEENASLEQDNIKKMGVTVFDDEYIKENSIESTIKEAIRIASLNTDGIHISFDLDAINPIYCPGVSVPELDGLNTFDAYKALDIIIDNFDEVKSFDLVEYNPINDINFKTKNIALSIVNKLKNKLKDK